MNYKIIALVLVVAGTGWAQMTNFQGPGVLSRGAGEIGNRSGQDVDLRYYANLTGIYDNQLQPIQVNDEGDLQQVRGLFGVQVGFGAYGQHNWRTSRLGLDYTGNYRYYQNSPFYSGTNHQLGLGYTYQQSRRVVWDLRTVAGSVSQANAFIGGINNPLGSPVDQNTLLFDNRATFVQGGMDVNYLLSARTTLSAGGSANTIRRESSALAGVNGYNLHGDIQHRLSEVTTIGMSYNHTHYDFPRAFGESNIDGIQATFAHGLSARWTMSLQGGLYQVQAEGIRSAPVDPAIRDLFGPGFVRRETYFQKNYIPYGSATITRRFQNASWSVSYSRGVTSGNGVFLTSRQESMSTRYSYTALRYVNFAFNAGYSRLNSIGLTLQPYAQYYGGTTVNYVLGENWHLNASYQARKQSIVQGNFRQFSNRVTFGIAFSPGAIPLAFH